MVYSYVRAQCAAEVRVPVTHHTFVDLSWDEGCRLIDSCTYMFATDIREAEELTLQVQVSEAKAQQALNATDVGEGQLEALKIGGRPIEIDSNCQTFRLHFDSRHMVSYTVSNESYLKYPEPPEAFTGKLLREFSWSYLLDLATRTTYASAMLGQPLRHFEIVCLNHVIDVICTSPPRIELGAVNASRAS